MRRERAESPDTVEYLVPYGLMDLLAVLGCVVKFQPDLIPPQRDDIKTSIRGCVGQLDPADY